MIEHRTKRLLLRLPRSGDSLALAELLNDYDVVKWLSSVPYPYTVSDAEQWVQIVSESINEESPSIQLSIFMNDALIGGVGLRYTEDGLYELGYWLAREYWGKGLALEAATELLRYVRENLASPRIVAHCAKDNAASMSVLRKLGFEVTGEVEVFCAPRDASLPSFRLSLP
jgi:8-oxo-dGTP diphosphatase